MTIPFPPGVPPVPGPPLPGPDPQDVPPVPGPPLPGPDPRDVPPVPGPLPGPEPTAARCSPNGPLGAGR